MDTNKRLKRYRRRSNKSPKDRKLTFKNLWSILIAKRYWFVISFVFFMAGAFVYLKLTPTTYLMISKVLIKEKDERSFMASNKQNFMANMGFANNSNGFDNELEVLASNNLTKIVVRDLKLYTQYYFKGRIRYKEFYGKYSPWIVDIDSMVIDTLSTPIILTMEQEDDGSVLTELSYNKKRTKHIIKSFPTTLRFSEQGTIRLSFQKKLYSMEDFDFTQKIKIVINPLVSSAKIFGKRLEVNPTSKTTTVALLSYKDNVPERGVNYLEHLTEVYNIDATADYNMDAQKVAEFINKRLGIITNELNNTDSNLEEYKRQGKIADYAEDVTLSTTLKDQYESRISDAQTQYRLVSDLQDFLNNPDNHMKTVSSNIGLANSTLSRNLQYYNSLVIAYQQLQRTASPNNPTLLKIEQQANDIQNSIRTSLNTLQKQYNIKIRDMQRLVDKYNNNLTTSPIKEHTLAQIGRQQKVKSGLFIMLLQKREENLIQLASTAYKAKEIEKPACLGYISPRPRMVYLIALALALSIPYLLFFAIQYFKIRITTPDELKKLTDIPIYGYIPFVKALSSGKRTIVLKENHNSIMMEVYRQLRLSLPFVMKPDEKVILFTSCVSGEGKTSVACNFGTSLAFTGKKVLLLGLDIRKPKLAGLFNLADEGNGISEYLARDPKDIAFLDRIIQKTDVSPNLDIITAGTIPPNPGELLMRPNMKVAIDYLKQKYDFIIMDTAPIGLVSDTLSLSLYADVTFYIVRANYTLKADMELINSYKEQGVFKNINIIFNAIKPNQYNASTHSYGSKSYGPYRTYGYGYGDNENETLEEV